MRGPPQASRWLLTRGGFAQEVAAVKAAIGRPPGLSVVLVGDRADSVLYVSRKQEARPDPRWLLADIPVRDDSPLP